ADAAVAIVTPGTTGIQINGGFLADSGNGVLLIDSKKATISNVIAVGSAGVTLYRTKKNTIIGGAYINNGGNGLELTNSDKNFTTALIAAANGGAGIR